MNFSSDVSSLVAKIKTLTDQPISEAQIFSAVEQFVEAGLCESPTEALRYMVTLLEALDPSPRLIAFHEFAKHPMLGKDYRQLSQAQMEECVLFIEENRSLNGSAFAVKANLWKLDQPEKRTTKHSIQWGLILQANTTVHPMNRRVKRKSEIKSVDMKRNGEVEFKIFYRPDSELGLSLESFIDLRPDLPGFTSVQTPVWIDEEWEKANNELYRQFLAFVIDVERGVQ